MNMFIFILNERGCIFLAASLLSPVVCLLATDWHGHILDSGLSSSLPVAVHFSSLLPTTTRYRNVFTLLSGCLYWLFSGTLRVCRAFSSLLCAPITSHIHHTQHIVLPWFCRLCILSTYPPLPTSEWAVSYVCQMNALWLFFLLRFWSFFFFALGIHISTGIIECKGACVTLTFREKTLPTGQMSLTRQCSLPM